MSPLGQILRAGKLAVGRGKLDPEALKSLHAMKKGVASLEERSALPAGSEALSQRERTPTRYIPKGTVRPHQEVIGDLHLKGHEEGLKRFREAEQRAYKLSRKPATPRFGLRPAMEVIEETAPTIAKALKAKNPSQTAKALEARLLLMLGAQIKGPGGMHLRKNPRLTEGAFLKMGPEGPPEGIELKKLGRFKHLPGDIPDSVLAAHKTTPPTEGEVNRLNRILVFLGDLERKVVKAAPGGPRAVSEAIAPDTIDFMTGIKTATAAQKKKGPERIATEFKKSFSGLTPQTAKIARIEAHNLARESPELYKKIEDDVMKDVIAHMKKFPAKSSHLQDTEIKALRRIFNRKKYKENPQYKLIFADRWLENLGLRPIVPNRGTALDQWMYKKAAVEGEAALPGARIYSRRQARGLDLDMEESLQRTPEEFIETSELSPEAMRRPTGDLRADFMPSKQIPEGAFDFLNNALGAEKTNRVWDILNEPLFKVTRTHSIVKGGGTKVLHPRRNILQRELNKDEFNLVVELMPGLFPGVK